MIPNVDANGFGTVVPPGRYEQVGLAMYELPDMIFAWTLFLRRPTGP